MGATTCVVGEFLPSTTRTLLFNLTVRDGDTGVAVAAVEVHTNTTSGPFAIRNRNTNGSFVRIEDISPAIAAFFLTAP